MDSIDPDTTDLKRVFQGESIDMSPEAISRRFEILNQLNRLCDWLGKAKDLGPVEPQDDFASGSAVRDERDGESARRTRSACKF